MLKDTVQLTKMYHVSCNESVFQPGKRSIKQLENNQINNYFEHSFHKRILGKNCITVSRKILRSKTVLLIRNVSLAANQHIRMISEGSCDNEDWSNDAENSALASQE